MARVQPRRAAGAFTLVELIAVIAITAILAGLSIPALANASRARTNAAARAVVQHLAFAREHALNRGNRTWVMFDQPTGRCAALVEPDGVTAIDQAEPLVDPRTGRPLTLFLGEGEFQGVGLSFISFDGGSTIGFDWLGTPLVADGQSLHTDGVVTIEGGPSIRISPITGDLQIVSP